MANTEMNLGTNKLNFVGYVKEQNLKKITGHDKNGKEYNAVSGTIVLKCGEFKEVDVKIFTKGLTSKGEPSRKYQTLCNLADGVLPTMASVKEGENPTVVSIWGNDGFAPNINENIYKNRNNEVKTNLQFNLGFGNITVKQDVKEEEFKAEFDIEIYVDSITDEINSNTDESTGRTLVNGYIPLYGGTVAPIELVAGIIKDDNGENFDMGRAIFDNLREGDTFSVYGDINFEKKVIETKSSGKGFGRAKIDTKTDYIHEFNILYGELVEDSERIFEEDDIKQALVQRDNKIEQKKNEEVEVDTLNRKGRGMATANREISSERGQRRRGF